MADNDDFEIIDDAGLSNEQVFEFIDVNDTTEKNTYNDNLMTSDVVLPFLISKPLVNEIPQVVEQQQQQQQTSYPIFDAPEIQESHSLIKTTTVTAPVLQIKKPVLPPPPPSTPITFAPVPPLPKPPGLQRYGGAALIPHNLDDTLDLDSVINKSRRNLQNTLDFSIQQQRQQDIQTVLEQRRQLFNKK